MHKSIVIVEDGFVKEIIPYSHEKWEEVIREFNELEDSPADPYTTEDTQVDGFDKYGVRHTAEIRSDISCSSIET